MPFSLNNPNPPVRFNYENENGPTGEWVELKIANLDTIKSIKKATTKTKREFKDGFTYQYEDVNEDKYEEMLWDKVIVSWKLVDEESNEEIPCNLKNKLLMMNNCPEFSRFILKCLETLKAKEAERQEELEKNS